MNPHDTALAYHQARAIGASRLAQVVALYDTVLRDLRSAVVALDKADVEKRVAAVNHALLVVGELQGVLDFKNGGDPARNLDNFYNVARSLILRASMKGSREDFQEALFMMTRLRSAWAKIESTVPNTREPQQARTSPAELPAGHSGTRRDLGGDSSLKPNRCWRA